MRAISDFVIKYIAEEENDMFIFKSAKPFIIAGYASVILVDKEGHLITENALRNAFDKFMGVSQYRNVMLGHTSLQVGEVIPKWGKMKSGVVPSKGLFVVCKIRDDLEIMNKVKNEIAEGNIRSFSIAGQSIGPRVVKTMKGKPYLEIDELELSEITLCEDPVNQQARFDIIQKGYSYYTPEINVEKYPKIVKKTTNNLQKALKRWLLFNLSGYCGKCNDNVSISSPVVKRLGNYYLLKGICNKCNSEVVKYVA